MNKEEARLTRWADGELAPDEREAFEEAMRADATLREDADAARAIGSAMRAEFLAEREPPAAELFNGHVAKKILDGGHALPSGGRSPARRWRAAPWLIAAAACLVAMVSVVRHPGSPPDQVVLAEVYTPDPAVAADVYFDQEARATVILLEGLEDVPTNREVKPYSVASHRVEPESGKTVFYAAGEPGKALFVMLGGDHGAPSLHEIE